jgi:syntaxin 1B/2/3
VSTGGTYPPNVRLIPSRDASAPQQTSYPPQSGVPSNGVIPPSRGTNPYAQQAVSAAPGGNYNQYGAQEQSYGGNQYAQGGNQYAQGGNPYAQQQQYGQQEQYAMGGAGAQGGDFWSELTSTNQNLTLLQEQIQAVRSAHQKSLVGLLLAHGTQS